MNDSTNAYLGTNFEEIKSNDQLFNIEELKNEIVSGEDETVRQKNGIKYINDGIKELTPMSEKRGEEKFQKVFDKYFTEIDSGESSDKANDSLEEYDKKLRRDLEMEALAVNKYNREFSSYYK